MKLINYDGVAYLPHFILNSDMLDFKNAEYDDESILIPFKPEVSDNLYFEHIKVILENKIRDFYQEEYWEDGEIEGRYSFIVWKNHDGGYTCKIQFLADNDFGSGCYDTYLCVNLNTDERKILQPIMNKAFGEKRGVA